MKRDRKPSAALTAIIESLDKNTLRRVEDRMLVCMDINKHLKEKGISQTELANKMQKSKSEVSEWLSGERNFTMDTLSDIYFALGVPMMNIITTHVRMIASPNSNDFCASSRAYSSYSPISIYQLRA